MNSPDLEALIARACDPRVGDRIIGPGSTHVTEVTAIIPLDGDTSLKATITGSSVEHDFTLRQYQWMARVSLECGETFHAVEDDEE